MLKLMDEAAEKCTLDGEYRFSNTSLLFSQFQQLGVPPVSIKHGLATMEFDKWIICIEPQHRVTMDDLRNGICRMERRLPDDLSKLKQPS
jgi:hypothetical protein